MKQVDSLIRLVQVARDIEDKVFAYDSLLCARINDEIEPHPEFGTQDEIVKSIRENAIAIQEFAEKHMTQRTDK